MDEDFLHPFEATRRQRHVILSVIRITFAVLILTTAVLRAAQSTAGLAIDWWIPIVVAMVLFGVALTIDLITPNKKISTISSVFLGLIGGMLATLAFGVVIDLLMQTSIEEQETLKRLQPFVSVVKIMLGLSLCYLGITTVIQTQDDFRLVIPYVEFSKQLRGQRPLVLDTSSLIDARIVDLAATGLIQSPLIVPRFVVVELQALADSQDKLKRARGRRGLDVTTRLQRSGLDVTLDETAMTIKTVDQMLIDLARRIPATIVTADVGLARVAQIQNVPILNLNDIANALKPSLIPGEQLILRLVKAGEQPGQGVGYLPDGTMVVVERAGHRIGDEASVQVTSSLQTSAGRLIFAKLSDERDDVATTDSRSGDSRSGMMASADSKVINLGALSEEADDGPENASDSSATNGGVDNGGGIGGGGAESDSARNSATLSPRRPGPFPPKPGHQRPSSARNPRR
jgi:uncharacterized protein YacL